MISVLAGFNPAEEKRIRREAGYFEVARSYAFRQTGQAGIGTNLPRAKATPRRRR